MHSHLDEEINFTIILSKSVNGRVRKIDKKRERHYVEMSRDSLLDYKFSEKYYNSRS